MCLTSPRKQMKRKTLIPLTSSLSTQYVNPRAAVCELFCKKVIAEAIYSMQVHVRLCQFFQCS